MINFIFFFFSSRRRHTRWTGDWSSDVCSSDLFLAEATHQGIESLEQLNDLFFAWAGQVASRRVHAETGQAPICRFEAGGPPRQADPGLLREAFRWPVTRKVTRTATVPLEGNACAAGPA